MANLTVIQKGGNGFQCSVFCCLLLLYLRLLAQIRCTVFNVKSFGAVGDGVSDDTEAFKLAWDAACHAEESGTVLVPDGHVFMIQSTIFTGPCNSALSFKFSVPIFL
ncbi:unnamed protein product [Sphenostylis stenocarpa]|uniref:Rhamnogalacturonase A/B/Epimerase-like pectate lyase domain-containing protein n=1 Tax=Sphenostylis stenocarpa TaxID=92480 RepID=A0AA86RWE6_9FABA|nr:unnamed protein product [Sphenostylis stenocarpa]